MVHRDIATRNVRAKRDTTPGQGTGKRDAASGQATGRRDAASGLATGKRDAASGRPTGRRDAASGMATGKRQHKPVRVTKGIDKATPLLAKALSSGNSMGNVTIQRTHEGKSETITLINATVAEVQKSGNTEHVTFNYQQLRQVPNSSVRGWNPKDKRAIQGTAK
ncbi:type VI secretion system tube protein Hcp [Opitutia bacterium ISCC 51]|nr:type VI secretion system tube protein Hcp [Opitutae bacterium ISCC 51]QXD27711.1 type VI secretion system tube protein Hcp [Opitutae bacterium ISCC 52]